MISTLYIRDKINAFLDWGSRISPSHLINHGLISAAIFGATYYITTNPLAAAALASGIYIGRELEQWLLGQQDFIATLEDAGVPTVVALVLYFGVTLT